MADRRNVYDTCADFLGTVLTSVILLYSNWNKFLYICIEKSRPAQKEIEFCSMFSMSYDQILAEIIYMYMTIFIASVFYLIILAEFKKVFYCCRICLSCE